MTRRATTFAVSALFVWLAAALPGCVAGPAPRDHFYRVVVAEPAGSDVKLDGVLEVERFTSDDTLRNRRMLKLESGTPEVTPYRYHLWVDSPTLLLQRALADYLRVGAVADLIVTPDAGATEDWQVNGNLRRLDQILGGSPSVHVEIELRLRRAEGESLVTQRIYAADRPADDATPAAAARAFSLAIGDIFERFMSDLRAAAKR